MRRLYVLLLSIGYFHVHATNHSFGQLEKIVVDGTTIEIYLPPAYDKKKSYPVVYFNDGQWLFGQSISGWRLDSILDSLIKNNIIKPVIVAGIYSDHRRMDNYIPYWDATIPPDFGNYQPAADQYASLLVKKIIPTIESKYSCSVERAIMGASFGGLSATWLLLNYPDVFSTAAAFSPSFWVADFKIFTEGKKLKENQKIWFDIGTAEWNYYVPFIKELGQQYGKNSFYYEVPGAAHISSDWSARVHLPFIIFAGNKPAGKHQWNITTEVIPSQSVRERFFLRLNPIIEFENGLKYSLSTSATYQVVNGDEGVINADGSFGFKTNSDLQVNISYKGEQKNITVVYSDIQKQKEQR